MSQCYHVELKTSVSRVVTAEDSVSYPIELTEILPPEDMKEVLREVLKEAGWESSEENADVLVKTGEGGETLTADLEAMELSASLSSEKQIGAEISAVGQGETTRAANRAAQRQLDEQADAMGDKIEGAGNREIQKEVTAQLAESEEARQRQMNELLQRVYTEALKRKAGQLGDILEVQESTSEEGSYELLIRVAQ